MRKREGSGSIPLTNDPDPREAQEHADLHPQHCLNPQFCGKNICAHCLGRETHAVMFAHGTERRLVSAQTSALVHRIHEIILAHLVRTEQHLASAGRYYFRTTAVWTACRQYLYLSRVTREKSGHKMFFNFLVNKIT
jgi:hypothetical protein